MGSQVASQAAKGKAANAQARFQNDRYSSNAQSAMGAYFDDLSRLQIRANQEDEALAQQSRALAVQAAQAQGQTATQAGARGVSGTSVDELMTDYSRLEAEEQFSLNRNRQMLQDQLEAEAWAARATAQSRISGATPQPVSSPSLLELGLGVGGSVLGGINRYQDRQLFKKANGLD